MSYSKDDLNQLFEEYGIDIPSNYGGEIVISKRFRKTTFRSRVNGSLVNQDFIKVLKDKFVDIHSQNQTYAFLQPKYHISLLDSYAKEYYGGLVNDYKTLYSQYQNLYSDLEKAKSLANATENQIEFIKFQITS